MNNLNLDIAMDRIRAFCRRWQITEFSVFGSVLRSDFRPDSDVDVLVSFAPGAGITFESRVQMLDELSAIFGRRVDLVDKKLLKNPFRRHAILRSREILYAA